MKPADIERLFAELKFDRDDRLPPDDARREQFRAGWEDSAVRRKSYAEATLRRLTWRNLGFRFGETEGRRPREVVYAVYDVLARKYETLWVPRSNEDHLLLSYWQRVGGRIYVEVPIGGPGGPGKWPPGCRRRRLDGVRLRGVHDPAIVRFSSQEFSKRVHRAAVELIEIKTALNRLVIGQIIAGRDMFRREYDRIAQRSVIICSESDTALEWVCRQHDILVETEAASIPPNHTLQRSGRAGRSRAALCSNGGGESTVKDSWSNSEAYERYVGRWSSRVGERFLDWLDARTDARWLDIGCGTGALSERILTLQEPSCLIGVEPSETFLAVAKERVQGESVEFRSGSGESLPVEDACIDYAVSGLVLNFVPDKDAAMRELLRVLAPGGVAACYVWDYAGHVQFMRYFWDAAVKLNPEARERDEGVRFRICRPMPLQNLFESAGFREVQVAPIDIPTPFESFEDYWRPFLNDVAPAPGYCVSLNTEERAKLEALVRDALPTDPDGMILLAARAWAVSGVRP